MQKVHFEKRFRFPLSATSYVEYPAGYEGVVTDERARAAKRAKALRGEPVPVTDEKPGPDDT